MTLKMRIAALALALGACATASSAAIPTYGTREGELACAGLANVAFRSASTDKTARPQIVAATAVAFGFYMGRLSRAEPAPTKVGIEQALAKLTVPERNTYGTDCLKRVSTMIEPK